LEADSAASSSKTSTSEGFSGSVGISENCSGSSTITIGDEKIICLVRGPSSALRGSAAGQQFSDQGILECEVRFAPFATADQSVLSQTNSPSAHERYLSQCVTTALQAAVRLDLYPKSTIFVHLLILEAKGNELSSCIMAASLALCDASVEQRDLVSSYRISRTHAAGSGTISSGRKESTSAGDVNPDPQASLTVAMMANLEEMTYCTLEGKLQFEEIPEMQTACISGCERMRILMESVLTG
jgi:ribonuclease PH